MSKRIERVNSLIQKELGSIILKEVELPLDALTTITKVECSIDLINARIYISVFPEEKKERVLYVLGKLIFHLQKLLNKRLRIRPIPKIRFVDDKHAGEASKIVGILGKIEKENKPS